MTQDLIHKITNKTAFLGFLILFVNFFAMKYNFYYSVWWFDMPMHLLGCFFVTFIGFLLYKKMVFLYDIIPLFVFAIIFIFVIGVAWEFFEFDIISKMITFRFQGILDTFSDICFDLAGSALACFYVSKKMLEYSRTSVDN